MTVEPSIERVLVEVKSEDNTSTSASGLVTSKLTQDDVLSGTILDVGQAITGNDERDAAMNLYFASIIGDDIVFPRNAGYKQYIDSKEHRIIGFSDVLGLLALEIEETEE